MGFRSTLDSLAQALLEAVPFDMASGESIKFVPAVNDRGYVQFGTGSTDWDVQIFLGGAGSYVLFDSGNSTVTFSGITLNVSSSTLTNTTLAGNTALGNTVVTGNATVTGTTTLNGNTVLSNGSLTGANHLSARHELKWTAGERGKPGIAADATDNTTATFAITDPLFMVSGTNCVSACVGCDTTGGITLTTTGAADDQVILEPHSTSYLSGWRCCSWLSNTSVEWECKLKTGADIVNSIIWAGLKLTNTPVATTDENQVFFRYETAANANAILVVSSIANTDTSTNTGVVLANATAVDLKISIDASRVARAYINGALVLTTAALTTNISLIPVIGIQTKDAAAASMTVRGAAISKAL